MTTIIAQAPCPCCTASGNPETAAGCAGPAPTRSSTAWHACLVDECQCLAPYTEDLCEDCYIETK